jgi:hypothetical protein
MYILFLYYLWEVLYFDGGYGGEGGYGHGVTLEVNIIINIVFRMGIMHLGLIFNI